MTDFADTKEHQVAMDIQSMMGAITDLCEMASTGVGYELVRQDIDDLELSHARLSQLLNCLRVPVQEAAE